MAPHQSTAWAYHYHTPLDTTSVAFVLPGSASSPPILSGLRQRARSPLEPDSSRRR
jgi:hypothetical protein